MSDCSVLCVVCQVESLVNRNPLASVPFCTWAPIKVSFAPDTICNSCSRVIKDSNFGWRGKFSFFREQAV